MGGDRAKMSTSGGPNCRPGADDQSAGSPQLPSQKPASMNSSARANKKSSSSSVIEVGKQQQQSSSREPSKASTDDTSASATMQKKSVSVDRKIVKKSAATGEERKASLHESHKKSTSLVKERGTTSKKTSVQRAQDKKSGTTMARKPSQVPSPSIETNTDPAKSKHTSEDTDSAGAEQKGKITPAKSGSLASRRAATHKPIKKTDSSVSLVRKKFEKKVDNNAEGAAARGTGDGGRKLTEPLPRVKISQNVFLKEDAEKRKPAAHTQQVSHMQPSSSSQYFQPLINKDSESGLHSENDSLQMNSKDGRTGGPLFSFSADLVPSPEPCERDPDLNCQNESINCIQKTSIIHSEADQGGVSNHYEGEEQQEEEEEIHPSHSPVPGLDLNDDMALDRSSADRELLVAAADKMRLGSVAGMDQELPESPAYRYTKQSYGFGLRSRSDF